MDLNWVMHLILNKVNNPGSVLGEIREIGSEVIFAHLIDASVSSDPAGWLNDCAEPKRVVVRCADPVHAGASHSEDAKLLASWSQSGWASFDEGVASFDRAVQEAGGELMIRPSGTGMLSDAICTCSWARRSESLGCKLLLDPVGWLVPSMMRDVDDHLARIVELCLSCPKVGAVLIRSVRANTTGDYEEVSISDGEIDPGLLSERLGGLAASAPSVVVHDRADLELLGL